MKNHRLNEKQNPELAHLLRRPEKIDQVLKYVHQKDEERKLDDNPWDRLLIAVNLWLFWIYTNLAFHPHTPLALLNKSATILLGMKLCLDVMLVLGTGNRVRG
jgi:hypothetical protein